MKTISITSDAPAGWCFISEISDELLALESELLPQYSQVFDFDIGICFRCLPQSSGWKSKRRFYNETAPWVGLDIVIKEEVLRPMVGNVFLPLNKVEQRLAMGKELYSFFKDSFSYYAKTIPAVKAYGQAFMKELKQWLIKNYWLLNDNGEFDFNSLSYCPFEKVMQILGKPTKKNFITDNEGNKVQKLSWENTKHKNITISYTLQSKVWGFTEIEIEEWS